MNLSVPISRVADLNSVEHSLRRLFNTQDGQPCQHLLTSGYQLWLTQVKMLLLGRLAQPTQSIERMPMIETYLPNYHIYFMDNQVYIDFIKPCMPKAEKRKRKSD